MKGFILVTRKDKRSKGPIRIAVDSIMSYEIYEVDPGNGETGPRNDVRLRFKSGDEISIMESPGYIDELIEKAQAEDRIVISGSVDVLPGILDKIPAIKKRLEELEEEVKG